MTLVVPKPEAKRDYQAGQIFFSYIHGSAFSHGIGLVSGGEAFLKDELVPSHTGIVLYDGMCIEAISSGMTITPLSKYFDDRHAMIWFKHPRMLDPRGLLWIVEEAKKMEGIPYDWLGLGGFPLTDPEDRGENDNFFQDDDRLFCSEAVATLLKNCPYTPPTSKRRFLKKHPSWWTPHDLNSEGILWAS
ncbi:MAG: hypothetical protein KKE29_19890 [Proteobacteria bacterium]|nr:hypothetical protein [Pseudomonadota bacterium]MBU4574429.1 hypothetical protein [Pseudomonadota bacterium]MBV1715952.1 hypothetical protein [Desulfarculus sp.]